MQKDKFLKISSWISKNPAQVMKVMKVMKTIEPVKQNLITSLIGELRVPELEASVTGTKMQKNLLSSS